MNAVLLHRHEREERFLYMLQLLWLLGAQSFAMQGGRDYPVPDPYSLFTPARPADRRSAQDIRRAVMAQFSLRKEPHHG